MVNLFPQSGETSRYVSETLSRLNHIKFIAKSGEIRTNTHLVNRTVIAYVALEKGAFLRELRHSYILTQPNNWGHRLPLLKPEIFLVTYNDQKKKGLRLAAQECGERGEVLEFIQVLTEREFSLSQIGKLSLVFLANNLYDYTRKLPKIWRMMDVNPNTNLYMGDV